MAFVVNKSDGTPLVELHDGEYDALVTALTLIGKGAPLYAEYLNENLVAMLENFSSPDQPRAPLRGQFWHDSGTGAINVYSGTEWRPLVIGDPSTAIPGGVVGGGAGSTLSATFFVAIDASRSALAFIAAGHVIGALSHGSIAKAALPATIAIGSDTLPFQVLFSAGLKPGLTLAEHSNAYMLNGTVSRALSADNATSASTALNAVSAQTASLATTAQRANSVVGAVDARGAQLQLDDNQIAVSKVAGLSNALANTVLPTGAIIAWHGTAANVPYGWVICDGNNGTPDLRGRFIAGATSSGQFAPHMRAGSAQHGHMTDASGKHTHTGTTGGFALQEIHMPPHRHANGVVDKNDALFNHGGTPAVPTRGDSIDGNSSAGTREGFTTTVGGGQPHSHPLSLTNSGEHEHAVLESSSLPPYHALYYIMKVI